MTATMAPKATEREIYRATHRELRGNAGIENRKASEIEAVADFGAAARRLRESVRGGADHRDGGIVRRPVSMATRRAADQARPAEPTIDLSEVEEAKAEHPAGKPRRFRLRSIS